MPSGKKDPFGCLLGMRDLCTLWINSRGKRLTQARGVQIPLDIGRARVKVTYVARSIAPLRCFMRLPLLPLVLRVVDDRAPQKQFPIQLSTDGRKCVCPLRTYATPLKMTQFTFASYLPLVWCGAHWASARPDELSHYGKLGVGKQHTFSHPMKHAHGMESESWFHFVKIFLRSAAHHTTVFHISRLSMVGAYQAGSVAGRSSHLPPAARWSFLVQQIASTSSRWIISPERDYCTIVILRVQKHIWEIPAWVIIKNNEKECRPRSALLTFYSIFVYSSRFTK